MNGDGCIPIRDYGITSAAALTGSGMMIEPYGEHSFAELKGFYEDIIKSSASDNFLLCGMSLLADMRAALLTCRKYNKKAAVLINIDEEMQTTAFLPADAALITLQSMGLDAFGIASEDEETVIGCIIRLTRFAKIPLFAELSNEGIDEIRKSGISVTVTEKYCFFSLPDEERETAITLADEHQAFFLEPDTTEISDGIPCDANLDEILSDISEEPVDILKIEINTPDDAMAFISNAHMATLPIMFSCEDDISLLLALMLYQGRALIDSECELEPETVEKAADKYGAILY